MFISFAQRTYAFICSIRKKKRGETKKIHQKKTQHTNNGQNMVIVCIGYKKRNTVIRNLKDNHREKPKKEKHIKMILYRFVTDSLFSQQLNSMINGKYFG